MRQRETMVRAALLGHASVPELWRRKAAPASTGRATLAPHTRPVRRCPLPPIPPLNRPSLARDAKVHLL
jgi:hypothetical protein